VRLQPPTHRPQLRGVAVAHRDDELGADEDRDLAKEDGLRLVHVASRPQDDEECLAIALELRALMRLDRVLDREFVQVELARHRGELLLTRLVETEPGDGALGLAGRVQFGKVGRLRRTPPLTVDSLVDDHACNAIPFQSGTDKRCPATRWKPPFGVF
jgi:hypothetical protein